MSWWKSILLAHRSSDTTGAAEIKEFFFPRPGRAFFIRMGVVAAVSFIVFKFLLLPCVIDGESMMPTYPRKGFTFCWKLQYLFSKPQYGDIVVIKYSDNVYFLKRIIGLPGDEIFFRDGTLFRNGKPVNEKYVHYISFWNTRRTVVKPGHLFVVGDNRSQPSRVHRFGQVRQSRIVGSPLF
jgi:signal peptidase I